MEGLAARTEGGAWGDKAGWGMGKLRLPSTGVTWVSEAALKTGQAEARDMARGVRRANTSFL